MNDLPEANTLVVYSDYLCPFCYLGKVSLESYLDEHDLEPDIEWRPFDIQGHERGADGELLDHVDDGKGEAYMSRVRANVERLKAQYDVEMSMDVPEGLDSWNAQKLTLAIQRDRPERFEPLHERLFEALWQQQRDIGDPEVLVDLGEEVGLEASTIRSVLDESALDRELKSSFTSARERGITGIPTFVTSHSSTRGAIPPEQFAPLFGRT